MGGLSPPTLALGGVIRGICDEPPPLLLLLQLAAGDASDPCAATAAAATTGDSMSMSTTGAVEHVASSFVKVPCRTKGGLELLLLLLPTEPGDVDAVPINDFCLDPKLDLELPALLRLRTSLLPPPLLGLNLGEEGGLALRPLPGCFKL